MTLIKSISGIRGTIGGTYGENLTPLDIVECTAGYGTWLKNSKSPGKVVVGRDARMSGEMVASLAVHTLRSLGLDVIDLGLSTTPTVEMAVKHHRAGGGIIFTASHNPMEWNALKFLNEAGEFISPEDGESIVRIISAKDFLFAPVEQLGSLSSDEEALERHIQAVLNLEDVDVSRIQSAGFKIVADCINSTGALALPALLKRLGVQYDLLNADMNGKFNHNPEPLDEHLAQIKAACETGAYDLGIVVDPDVDRLAFICEDGQSFGEEYTLVAIADHILASRKGPTVSNLSSSRALRDVSSRYDCPYFASEVGEVNVVRTMKEHNAVIGGEGNGGIIVPELHYGRDALVGVALFLSYLAAQKKPMTKVKAELPQYHMVKDKVQLQGFDVDEALGKIKEHYKHENTDLRDGIKVDFENGWVHIRKSNTEPILRIYAEAKNMSEAEGFVGEIRRILS